MAGNFEREEINRNLAPLGDGNIKKKSLDYTKVCDGVFAQLTDMFGDVTTSENILIVCNKNKWDLSSCIDNLIQIIDKKGIQDTEEDSSLKVVYKESTEDISDEMDVVIESETTEILKDEIMDPKENIEVINNEMQSSHITDKSKSALENDNLSFADLLKETSSTSTSSFNFPQQDLTNFSNFNKRNKKSLGYPSNFDKIIHLIKQNIKLMIIMRGPPGCGKTFFSKKIIDETTKQPYENHIFSADNYFYRNGRYIYEREKVSDAHEWNQREVRKRCQDGWSPIIIDNTNIKIWELYVYVDMAVEYGYFIEIVEPYITNRVSSKTLTHRNLHDVPLVRIQKMCQDYESISVPQLIKLRGHDFHLEISPQQRQFPKIDNDIIEQKETMQVPVVVENLEPVWSDDWDKPKTIIKTKKNPIEPLPARENIPNLLNFINTIPNRENEKNNENQVGWNEYTDWNEKSKNIENSIDIVKNELKDLKKMNDNNEDDPLDMMRKLEKHKIGCENENKSFSQIRQIYPNIPIEYLWDLFENCRGDGNWTMDLLLKDEANLDDYDRENSDNFNCKCDSNELISFDNDPEPVKQYQFQQPSASNSKLLNNKKDKNTFEDLQNVKRKIEETITLGNEYYSDHTRKIRDIRRGVQSAQSEITDPQLSEIDTESSESENDEILEISLGVELVSQLDGMFGINSPKTDLKHVTTNVFMPKSIAKQLYALWIESLYNQIEVQKQQNLKEDEEFAKNLQIQENYSNSQIKKPTNLKEIMDMELTWASYKTEMNEWKNTTKQTLAHKLSKDKLKHIFPDIDMDILEEILAAHNNKFDETVNTLKDSLKGDMDNQIEYESSELFEQARLELEKSVVSQNYNILRSSNQYNDSKKVNADEAKRLALQDFEEYRNSAMHHHQLKMECYTKAQNAKQRGENQVALYYVQVANLHKIKVDMCNQKAANCIMEVHHYTQNNPDILDLHYLRVAEAIECLDIFLDKHINKLKLSSRNCKDLHVITGRGLHSAGGIPTIKHKVKGCLKDRNLKFAEVNPGLIKVRVLTNSKLSQF